MTRLTGDWLDWPGTGAVCAVLTDAGHRALFVGGCVRDALLGRQVKDIDIATDAAPEAVLALAGAAGIKAVPTGLAHGTVTLVAEGRPYEVTTFRRDVETFGRHARVSFTTELSEDAARRDFTMNALYAMPDGLLVDPLGGLDDLRSRRVRFVGEPAARISEDYLRILRFFRFHAWYGDHGRGLDPAGLAACALAGAGLAQLSRERVGAEIARLLAAPDPTTSVCAMADAEILPRVLPDADAAGLPPLVALEAGHDAGAPWTRRLLALGWRDDWPARLRMSRAERKHAGCVAAAARTEETAAALAYRHGVGAARDVVLIRAARRGAALPEAMEEDLDRGAGAQFPLGARDLGLSGPVLGAELARLEAAWIESGFSLTGDELRAMAARPPGT